MNRFNFSLALIIIAGAVWAAVFIHHEPDFRVYFLDVGQGDASYISMPDGKDALIDGGPGDRVLTELGQVMPFYDKDLDLVILTHNHADHLDGIVEVLKRYYIKEMWISGAIHTSDKYTEMLKLLKDKQIRTVAVREGEEKYFGSVKVRVVYPEENFSGVRPEDQHEATVVTRWTYGKFSMLQTGDLSKNQVEELTNSKEILKASILKVPHHGSATGLTVDFLARISPQMAVISAGKKNSFGHPKISILNLLKSEGVKIFRTDLDGRVRFQSDGVGFGLIR